jgi:tetratricopeptide (TPR) repeat protein
MRIRACAFVLIALSMPAISFAPDVAAQASGDAFTDMARQRFQEGVRLFDQGKFEEARAAFLQAYALKKHPAVLLNLAQSELRSNHPVEAARHFSEFLRDNPSADPAERKAAEDGLASARTKTARIDVKVDVDGAEVFIDGDIVGRAPLPEAVDVAAGVRKVEVRVGGRPPQTAEASASIGQVQTVTLTFGVPNATQDPVAKPDDDAGFEVSTEGRKPFVDWVIEDKVAWATGGATVLGLGFGIMFAAFAQNASSNADSIAGQIKVVAERDPELENYDGFDRRKNPCADPIPITSRTNYSPACSQLQDNLDTRDTDKTVATVGFVVAGLGAVSTGVLYFLRTEPEKSPSATTSRFPASTVVAPVFGPDIRGLSIGGTF